MPIRDAYNYIQENSKAYSIEVLVEELRKGGYREDDIQAAVAIFKNTRSIGADAHFPSLHDITIGGKKTGGISALVHSTNKGHGGVPDPKAAYNATLLIGAALPIAVYYLSFFLAYFLETIFFVPDEVRLILFAASIMLSFILYLGLHEMQIGVAKGMPYGIGVLMVWGLIVFASFYFKFGLPSFL